MREICMNTMPLATRFMAFALVILLSNGATAQTPPALTLSLLDAGTRSESSTYDFGYGPIVDDYCDKIGANCSSGIISDLSVASSTAEIQLTPSAPGYASPTASAMASYRGVNDGSSGHLYSVKSSSSLVYEFGVYISDLIPAVGSPVTINVTARGFGSVSGLNSGYGIQAGYEGGLTIGSSDGKSIVYSRQINAGNYLGSPISDFNVNTSFQIEANRAYFVSLWAIAEASDLSSATIIIDPYISIDAGSMRENPSAQLLLSSGVTQRQLSAVPEPAIGMLMLAGLLGFYPSRRFFAYLKRPISTPNAGRV